MLLLVVSNKQGGGGTSSVATQAIRRRMVGEWYETQWGRMVVGEGGSEEGRLRHRQWPVTNWGLLKISSSAMLCEALLPPANLAKPCYPPCETGQERSTRGADGLETAQNARRTPNEAIKRTPRGR